MAHIIEVIRNSEAEARSFLDALFYSDFVSAIGFRKFGDFVLVIAVNWNVEPSNEIDRQFLQMLNTSMAETGVLDEISAYCRIFPETIPFDYEKK